MSDVWGEVNKLIEYHKSNRKELFDSKLKFVHELCYEAHCNPYYTAGEKWELRQAQWELYDFYLWDNICKNDYKSVMRWFDQWVYDINYDLV